MIGAGGIARVHLNALSKIPEVEIAGIYDVDRDRAAEAAKEAGGAACGSIDELLSDGGIDALFICSPQFARDDTEAAAAERGIHIFVEKPLGLELEPVIRKEARIRQSGVIHSVGYCLRYLDTVCKAKEYLQDKQVDMVIANRFSGSPPQTWWKQQHLSGGQLVDMSTHQVDLVRYLAGEFDELYAKMARRSIVQDDPRATIYDVGSIAFSLAAGAVGSINNTCLQPNRGRAEVEIFGRNYYVGISGTTLRIVDDGQDVTLESQLNMYEEEDRQFIEAVRTGDPSKVLCSYADALKTLAVTLAANESAQLGRPVRMSEDKFRYRIVG
jgi:predicted dehydrogenase